MRVAVIGIGSALPPHAVDQAHAAELLARMEGADERRARLLQRLFRRSGVAARGSVLLSDTAGSGLTDFFESHPTTGQRMLRYAESAPELALRAARSALETSGLTPDRIDHLISVSCTGFAAPGLDIELIESLELRHTVSRTHVGFMGCHGALNGLRLAQAFSEGPQDARVLLVAVELCSLHLQDRGGPLDAEGAAVSNALFADGAGALVTGPSAEAQLSDWALAATGSTLLPRSRELMGWRIGDHGFEMTLDAGVAKRIEAELRGWLEPWLASQGIALDEVGSWAVHPGGPRILEAVEQGLGLSRDATAVSRAVLEACGNMSSATVIHILEQLQAEQAARPCVALAFGPGLVIEAALFL